MKPHKIKALMMDRGVTSVSIAVQENVTETWVSLVLNGKRHSPRIRKAIAKAVGKSVREIWPGDATQQRRKSIKSKTGLTGKTA